MSTRAESSFARATWTRRKSATRFDSLSKPIVERALKTTQSVATAFLSQTASVPSTEHAAAQVAY
jgi:hypothetical protein